MLFSILIAHYNNFGYFRECYDSILAQTYKSLEIIIVDDGSIDDSVEKIRSYTAGNPDVNIYINETNRGVGYTKRRCVELAQGDYCGFVDPDDKLTPDAIEKSVEAYAKDTVATYSQLYLCDEDLNITKIFPNTRRIKNGDPLFLNINFEVAHFFTFRRSAYLVTEGIGDHYCVAEDQDLMLKLYEQGNFAFIKTPLYYYRLHDKGLSHQAEKMQVKQENWHEVLYHALERRQIKTLFGSAVGRIEDLPKFVSENENGILKRVLRKLCSVR